MIIIFLIFLILGSVCFFNKIPHQVIFKRYYGYKYIETNNCKKYESNVYFLICGFNFDVKLLQQRLQYLSERLQNHKILIYALDSTNLDTITNLKKWESQNNNLHLLPVSDINKSNRLLKMTNIRNLLLEYAINLKPEKNTKFIIYDADHIGPMSRNGLINSLEYLDNHKYIYAICSSGSNTILHGISFLYDTFAFVNINNKAGFKCKLHCFLKDHSFIISGFSGAVIYRFTDLKHIRYTYTPNTCEHVILHKKLKMYYDLSYNINSYMIMFKQWNIYVGSQPSVH